jgi:hypothetical protein
MRYPWFHGSAREGQRYQTLARAHVEAAGWLQSYCQTCTDTRVPSALTQWSREDGMETTVVDIGGRHLQLRNGSDGQLQRSLETAHPRSTACPNFRTSSLILLIVARISSLRMFRDREACCCILVPHSALWLPSSSKLFKTLHLDPRHDGG